VQEARARDPSSEYRLFQRIGRGGMGQVFAGVRVGHGDLLVPCVIKVLHPELADTPKDRERFRDEARIAAQLDHGRIVKVIDSGEMQGCPFLVMERVDGVSLRDLTHKLQEAGMPRLDVDVSLFIVGEILAALQYAHHRTIAGKDAGVIHYDVTPGNILVSSSGEIKLTDFGIARFAATSEGAMSRSIGTPRYMSPEQILGHARRETDIYSLGVVLHELLDGSRYLVDLPMDQFRARVISGPPAELVRRDIPRWLDRLRHQMLSPRAEDRPAASDARTVLLENCSRYHLAGQTLTKLYSTVIGQQRSGLTEHLLSLREEIEIFRETSGPVRAAVEQPEAATPPSEVDAVPSLRRKDRHQHTPSDPSEWGPTHSHTNTVEPPIEPTERLSSEEMLRFAARRLAEPREPAEKTESLPALVSSEPFTEVPAVVPEAPAPTVEPEVHQIAVITPMRIESTPRRRLGWVVGGMGSLIVLLVGCVIWLAAHQHEREGEGSLASAELPNFAPDSPKAPVPVVAVAEPEIPVTPPPPVLQPVPEIVPESEPATEPAVVSEPEVRQREPVKQVPRVEVTFLIPNVDQGEIKVGSKTLKYNYAALTKLKPGKYTIQWRKNGETEWRKPGTLIVDALPSGEYYEVKLGTSVVAKPRKEGSK
jgi:serine/threonine protein kinase